MVEANINLPNCLNCRSWFETFCHKVGITELLEKISIDWMGVLPGKLSLDWLLSRLDSDEIGGNLGATVATSGRRIPRSMSSSLVARTEIFRSRPENDKKKDLLI